MDKLTLEELQLLLILLERERIWAGEVKGLSRFPDMQKAMDERMELIESIATKVVV